MTIHISENKPCEYYQILLLEQVNKFQLYFFFSFSIFNFFYTYQKKIFRTNGLLSKVIHAFGYDTLDVKYEASIFLFNWIENINEF